MIVTKSVADKISLVVQDNTNLSVVKAMHGVIEWMTSKIISSTTL